MSSFNFRGTDQQKLVGALSGGERNRVHLAKLLQSGGNVLLLDEPTNDLDVDTLRALETGLESFPGCVVVISHDRWFLDRIATHVLAFEGDSQVRFFEGNVTDYAAFRHTELGSSAEIQEKLSSDKGYVGRLVKNGISHEENVRGIFLRVFARSPRPRELAVAMQFLESQTDRKEAYGSLLWSLLATIEFLFNH